MAKLIVISGEMKDRVFEFTDEKISVGRLPENKIQLDDHAVSSYHAEFTLKGEDYVLRDLNSTNGTRVNGQRIVETRLSHGDMIHFGHFQLQYLSSQKNAPQPLPLVKKKTVDLTASVLGKIKTPAAFGSSSPFLRGKKNLSKKVLQFILFIISLLAVSVLVLAISKILQMTK